MENNGIKKAGRRSNAYPSLTVMESVDLTALINKNAGHHFVKLEDIAKITNKSAGAMSQKVGTAVQYGLLEMKSGIGYRPTELFKKISRPVSPEERHQGLIEAFKNPKLYEELITKFTGSPIPSEIILSNILERDLSIYDEAAKKAAATFLENVEDLNLRNSYDELELEKKVEEASQGDTEVSKEKPKAGGDYERQSVNQSNAYSSEGNADLLRLEVGLTNNKKAIILYPRELMPIDIEIIKLQITVLEKIVESNKADKSSA